MSNRAAIRVQRPECESVRGEWGEIFPDCHQLLPRKPGPLHSRKPPVYGRPPRPNAFGLNR